MMKIHVKVFVAATVVAGLFLFAFLNRTRGAIIKLCLGDVDPDIEYTGGVGGVLSTMNDGDLGTPGEQNTAIDFLDFLSGMTDITSPDASYTLNGVTAVGPASILFGVVVAQGFVGGEFQVYNDVGLLLL